MHPLGHCDLKGVDLWYATLKFAPKEFLRFLPVRSDNNLPDIMARFGNRLREIREEVGISQEKLADLAGVHRTYVSSVERGKRNVSLVNIERFAAALGVVMGDLMPDTKRKR